MAHHANITSKYPSLSVQVHAIPSRDNPKLPVPERAEQSLAPAMKIVLALPFQQMDLCSSNHKERLENWKNIAVLRLLLRTSSLVALASIQIGLPGDPATMVPS